MIKYVTTFQTGHFPYASMAWESDHGLLRCVAVWFVVKVPVYTGALPQDNCLNTYCLENLIFYTGYSYQLLIPKCTSTLL
jgi:hypothetical protein